MRHVRPRFGNVLGFRLNWNQAVRVDYEFMTEIRTTRSGVEQREAVRQTPRVTLSYPFTVTADAADRIMRDMRAKTLDVWSVPVPWRRARLAVAATEASTSLRIAGAPFWAEPGIFAVVRGARAGQPVEAIRVVAVDGDELVTQEPLQSAYGEGASVHFAYPARLPEELRFQSVLPDVYSGLVALEVDPGVSPQPTLAGAIPRYRDSDVLLLRPNWRDGVEIGLVRTADRVDFGRGRIEVSDSVGFTNERRRLHVYAFDQESAEQMIGFFMRQKGRRGSFWAPSWSKDVRRLGTVSQGASFFYTPGTSFAESYAGDRVRSHLIHMRPDGSFQANRVTGMAADSGRTRIDMSAAWQRPIAPTDRLHWLFRCRFGSDTLSVAWESPDVAHAEFATVAIPADEVSL